MAPPSYAGPGERAWHYILRGLCVLTLFFLVPRFW